MNVNELHKARKIKLYHCKICGCEMQCISRKFYCDDCKKIAIKKTNDEQTEKDRQFKLQQQYEKRYKNANLIECIKRADELNVTYGEYMSMCRI